MSVQMECASVNGCAKVIQNGTSAEFEEIQIPVSWGHIAAKWWGSKNQQPIIALHGWQDNAGTYDRLAPLLAAAGHSLLCVDFPGHGLSSHYPPGVFYYIFWDGLLTVRRIVKHFKWQKVTLMGHSLGGAVSFLYAASYPDEVVKYISIDIASPAVRSSSKMVSLIGGSIDKYLHYENLATDKMPCNEYDEMINTVEHAHAGSLSRESCEILMRRGMVKAPAHLHANGYLYCRDPRLKVASLGFMGIAEALEFAGRIKCKVLNIKATSGRDDILDDYYFQILEKIKENTELVYHEVQGTHHLHLNDGHAVFGFIDTFLRD